MRHVSSIVATRRACQRDLPLRPRAAAFVALLTGPTAPTGVHELTGPALVSLDEVAAVLSRAAGHPVAYQPATLAEFTAELEREGVPAEQAHELAATLAGTFDGRNQRVTRGVEELTGRPARSFAEFAAAALSPTAA